MKSSYSISISININMSDSIIISHQHEHILSSSISTSNSISINISIVVGYYISISRKELYQYVVFHSVRAMLYKITKVIMKILIQLLLTVCFCFIQFFIILIHNQTLWAVIFLHEMTSLF